MVPRESGAREMDFNVSVKERIREMGIRVAGNREKLAILQHFIKILL
jgi:hypothetical protein